jgi:glucosyl-dolichyl phosphate glucuronosyltransferase
VSTPVALSVIVPTFRRTESLLRTVASLREQEGSFEILVVDNAVDDALRDALRAVADEPGPPVRWLPEPRAGQHYARATGVRHAAAELLAFVDDDVTFAPGWAQAYIDAFAAHPRLIAAGGPSHAAWAKIPPDWLMYLMSQRRTFFQLSLRDLGGSFQLNSDESFWGLNMAVRKAELLEVGGFNPDMLDGYSVGDGDGGLFRKFKAAGMCTGYVPGALVYHWIPAERMTVAYLLQRMRNEGASESYAVARRARGTPRLTLLRMLVTSACSAACFRLMAAPFRWSRRTFPLRLHLRAAERAGRVQYAWAALRDARLRRMIFSDDWATPATDDTP